MGETPKTALHRFQPRSQALDSPPRNAPPCQTAKMRCTRGASLFRQISSLFPVP
ncbi:hypothetical protein [Moorena producens]|uniref:hypothetical protein n=1 Tax=Moorena producens TaxID=1155739 RepID=UPI003C75645F